MSYWKRTVKGDIAIHQAKTIGYLPGVCHGFTTRIGGVSQKPFDTLNLSSVVGDNVENVEENRRRAVIAVMERDCPYLSAYQVHGNSVAVIDREFDASQPPIADALVTNQREIALFLLFADCVPIFFFDPIAKAVGIAHSGWRGTASNIASHTVESLIQSLGCVSQNIFAAIGPSISAEHYEVSRDVVDQLCDAHKGGSSTPFTQVNEFTSKWLVDLRVIIFDQLVSAGIRPENIEVSNECTYSNRADFFSHRRDSKENIQLGGRMGGLIGLA